MATRNYRGPIIDTDLHHNWKESNDVLQYLPKEWQQYANGEAGMNSMVPNLSHARLL